MCVEQEWKRFIEDIATKMAEFDVEGATHLRCNLTTEAPPDKQTLEWSKAYVNLQHYAIQFIHVCTTQQRMREAFAVSYTMQGLNDILLEMRREPTSSEFCKQVQF
jgi:hypothetical protein